MKTFCLALALAGPLSGEPDEADGKIGENTELVAALIVDEMYEADLAVESAALVALRVQNEALRAERDQAYDALAACEAGRAAHEAACQAAPQACRVAEISISCDCPVCP